ncbi:MAG: energy-coupling factor transporter ATPase [Clostridia bacterium]|nr:energy-coupling factor transporter ATPase [Clostridia bacterium]
MDMLRAIDVHFDYTYENEAPQVVLQGVNLTIEKGAFVAVLGHNGCGKSTLAKHFNALLLPTGGQVIVADMDTANEDNTYPIRRRVGMVLQNPDNQLVSTIVEEDVAFGPENLGLPPAEIRARVDEALAAVDMTAYKDHAPHRLSGGQKQRIAIAGVLAMHPDCLLLDEPTAMLDPQGRREVLDTVCRLNRENGMTVVLITHYMEEAALADRVVVMDEGKVVLDGTPREVFAQGERLTALGLDVPQPTALCTALRAAGVEISADLLTPEECADAILKLLKN